jgi:hypothetical protein
MAWCGRGLLAPGLECLSPGMFRRPDAAERSVCAGWLSTGAPTSSPPITLVSFNGPRRPGAHVPILNLKLEECGGFCLFQWPKTAGGACTTYSCSTRTGQPWGFNGRRRPGGMHRVPMFMIRTMGMEFQWPKTAAGACTSSMSSTSSRSPRRFNGLKRPGAHALSRDATHSLLSRCFNGPRWPGAMHRMSTLACSTMPTGFNGLGRPGGHALSLLYNVSEHGVARTICAGDCTEQENDFLIVSETMK